MSIDTANGYISQVVLPPKKEGDIERLYLIKDKDAQDNIKLLQSDLTSLDSELNTLDNKIDNIDIPNISNLVSTDDLTNTVSGLISKKETNDNYVTWSSLLTYYPDNATLKNNYAHITDGIIDNATINHEDVNGLSENYAHIAQGKIINAIIDYSNVNGLNENYAHITDGIINNATINYTDINDLNNHYASISNGIIDNASIDYTKINNLNDNYAHITNGSIDNATISHQKIEDLGNNYAHIVNGIIDNANIDYANVNNLNTNYAHITDGVIDNANIDQANINNLDANYAHIENGVIDNATIDQAKVNNLDANYAHIQNGVIDNANIDQANVNNLDANYAHITNGTIDNANINYANVSNLNAHYAHLEDGIIDNALIGYANVDQLDSHYAEIDMANVNNAWIENGVIKDAAITDAQILGVSANKLTAGKIDAANINVINLRADNLIVTKINGQPVIGGYTLVDPAISGYADKNPSQEKWYEFYNNLYTLTVDTVVDPNKNYYTTSDSVELYDQATIDGMLDNINARIDSQIETWTVDELPTLNNYPANQWDTDKLKDAHIGDICYVVNAADDYNGYTYRFAYDNKSQQYSWILIQDNDTAATLGRITQLEEFNNQLVHWEDATDEGVTTVRGRFTELSGRIDKVVKSSIQLWHTAENTTLPDKPTSAITSVSTEGNIWTSVVPIYNANYPYYFYCWQYQYEDESYDWSAVVYDQATTEAQERARTGVANAATAQSTAEDNIRSNVQLWFTKKDKEEFPNKPTSQITNNSVTGNTSYNRWNLVVPTYNVSYPYYFYCYQQQKGDGTYQWTDVVYDDITSTAMETARSAISTFETFEQTTFKEVTDTIDTQGTTITQLQTATKKALSQGIEYIVGTHGTTATSNWTGVTQEEQLYTGKQIAYYMTSAGVSNNPATLTLKLSDDAWTEPIKVKINNTDVTDQYPKDTVIKLTYDGGAWKSDNYNSDTNYYDREAYKASVTANGAISAGRIGVFGTDGKLKLLSNSTFDTSYPILYIGTAYTTNALTQTNNYTFWGTPFNLTNTHAITGATAGKPVYIVGALNGNIMTPTSEVLTCAEPTEENGLFYLRLGLMSTASNAVLESQHPIYAFMDGKFQQTTQSVVTVSNTVNTVKQTADTNSAKISNLTQTLGTNTDGTTAENDIIHQISEINQDLDGISTRVSKTEASLRSSTFATSSTAANTAAKVATIFPENNDFELYTGATITVKFTSNNTASAPTLKINSTEAKPIKTYSGANLSEAEYKWDAGATMTFIYDGTNWRIQDSTELTRLKNNESRITQTADSITSLVANNETYTAPDGTTKTNTIRSAIKQNADNIDLRVEKANVIASINASVETDGTSAVKISADKVNIEGAAIFNSGRLSTTSLNNAYDSKGSASAAQTAAINAAAADATQKANDAQSAAEATASKDATQKANAAQSAAISAAATDATEKANAARDAAISAAATDATNKVNAVNKQEQLIYIQAVSGTLSIPDNKKPTSWVTNTGESVSSDEEGLTPVWTTKRPTYRSNYPVLFVATQRQTVGGTLTCTTPLKDDTTTVIDGGHITTGTIDATTVNVTNIDASEIVSGSLTSTNYQEAATSGVPYSTAGSKIELSTGNIYTPSFGVINDSTNTNYPVGLYINDGFVARNGKIGWSAENYWDVGTLPLNSGTYTTGIVATGNSLINVGELILESNRDSNNNASLHTGTISKSTTAYTRNYLRDPDNHYRDYGLQAPVLNSSATNYTSGVDDNFLYIKKSPGTSVPSLEKDWDYLFRVDKDGNVYTSGAMYINGELVQSGGNFVKTSGNSTINGSLTITNGTLIGALNKSVTFTTSGGAAAGSTYNGSNNLTVSYTTIGAAAASHTHSDYAFTAGTGLSLNGTQFYVSSANVSTMINLLSEGASPANRNDYAVVQYVNGGTTTTTYHRRKLSNVFAALNSSDITTALGFTPYNATNPNGYTSNTGTVTSIKLIAGGGISLDTDNTAITASGSRTISHADTSSQESIAASDRTYIKSVTLDTYGHVTGLTTGTETVTNTHNTAYLYTGASNGSANAATTNDNTYLILKDGNSVTSRRKISGSGTVSVTSDANGNISIAGTAHPTTLKNPNAIKINVYNGSSTATTTTYDGGTANQSVNVASNNALTGVSASTSGGKTTFTLTTAAGATSTFDVNVTGAVVTGATTLTKSDGTAVSAGGATTKPVYFSEGLPIAVTSIPYSLLTGTPTFTLNGSAVTSPSWYAPTAAGTATQVLIGGGNSAAPTWKNIADLTPSAATKATNDSDGNQINTTYLKKSGGTLTGAINTANNTWNKIGDDVQIGDINEAGTLGIQGVNGNTAIRFTTYNQTTKTTGGKISWDGTNFTITGTINTSISGNAATASAAPWSGITDKPATATRWPAWNEISQSGANNIEEGASDLTDNSEILTSYASNNGFADSNATGKVYRRDAIHVYNYIKGKTDNIYVKKSGDTMTGYLTTTNLGITNTSSTAGNGISLYNGGDTAARVWNYGIAFAGTGKYGKHGAVQGDWATYFTMAGANNRGWIFKHDGGQTTSGNVASISSQGKFQGLSYNVAGHCNLEYNTTTESLDFIFV